MQSLAKTVDEYLAEIPGERLAALQTLRALVRERFPNHSERMVYGMVGYFRGGEREPEIAFASQKQYVSVYLPVPVVEANRNLLAGLNVGKCCVRYSSPKKMDFEVLGTLFQATEAMYSR